MRGLRAQGLPVHSIIGDVRDRAQMQEIVQSTETLGGLDIMVANAGDARCCPVPAYPPDWSSKCQLSRILTPVKNGLPERAPRENAGISSAGQALLMR